MEIIRKVIAVLAAIGFLLTAVFALFVVNAANVITDRQAVVSAVTETGGLDGWVRTQAPQFASRLIQEQMEKAGLPPIAVDNAALAAAAVNLIPPQWVEAQAETAVNAIYDYLETGDPTAATVRLDVQPLLVQLEGDAGKQMITFFVSTLPPCSADDVGALLSGLTGGGEIPTCIPPGVGQETLAAQAHTMIAQSLRQNPQLTAGGIEISLLQNMPPAELQRLERARQAYLLADQWAWTLWLLPLLALLTIALFAIRSLRTLGLWWGWPLTLTGGLALLLALFVSANVAAGSAAAAASFVPGGAILSVLAKVWQELNKLWLNRVYLQAGLMFGLGLFLLLAAWWSGRSSSVV